MTGLREGPAATRTLEALRDFFMARDADDLAFAWIKLSSGNVFPPTFPSPPAVPDWEAVEFSFNKLFVGPQAPLAPPFASIYLDPEPYVMGPSTLEARRIYHLLGLQSPLEGSFPDDHVSFELDALLVMQAGLGRTYVAELEELRDFFLKRRLLAWIPAFSDGVCSQDETHPAIAYSATLLKHCLMELDAPFVSPGANHSDIRQLIAQ